MFLGRQKKYSHLLDFYLFAIVIGYLWRGGVYKILGNKKVIFAGLVLASGLVLSACNAYKSTSSAPTTTSSEIQQSSQAQDAVTITATEKGFEPSTVTVKSGGTITWKNNSSSKVQVGSSVHPTHEVNRELTNGEFVLEVAPGESKAVTVTKAGSWGYHDHLNPTMTGKVVVE